MATLHARLSTLTACSPSRCLRTRSSCDVRVHIRFWILPSSVSTLSRKTSLDIPLRVHDQELLAALTFPCLPCSPFGDHGQHFIGSQSTGSRIRVTFRRGPATILFSSKIAPSPRTRQSRPPSPFDHGVRLAVQRFVSCPPCDVHFPQLPHVDPLRACTSCDIPARNQPPLCLRSPVLSDKLPLASEASCFSVRTLRCVRAALDSSARIDSHLSTLTIHRHFRAHVRARVRVLRARFARLSLAFRRSSSEPLPAIHVHAHVQSHLSMLLPFGSSTFECRDLPASAPREIQRLLSTEHPAMSSTPRSPKPFGLRASLDAA